MTKNILNFIKNFFHKNEKFSQTDIDEFDKLEKKPLLFVKGLSKKYFGRKNNAIDDISFNVFPGEFHAFIGANGAGKTTTIKSIIGAYSK
jgi:ABC-2 type transport system ATP-binding protein